MLDRDQLEAFSAVLKFQSFERAANHLHLTRGAISQRVRALEESLSRVLIIRSKPISATSHGELLIRYVQTLQLMEAETLSAMCSGRQLSKSIRITLGGDPDSISTWFSDVLLDITKMMAVSFDLLVERPAAMLQMLQRGELFGCVSNSPIVPAGFSSDSLGALRYRCVADSRLAAREFPDGFSLQRVLATHALMIRGAESLHEEFLDKAFGFSVRNFPQHSFPTPEARLSAIRSGIGYGFAPERQICKLVQSGEVVDLLPDQTFDIDLYWHQLIVKSASCEQIRMRVNYRATEHLKRNELTSRSAYT